MVDVAMIGHFAKDKLVYHGQTERSSGGAVYYGSIALRRMGVSVAVITRLREDDFPLLDELKAAGVLVFAQAAEQTSGIENTYFTPDMDRRICKPLGFAGPFRLEDVPPLEARVFSVVPIIAGEVSLSLLKALAQEYSIALDVQGFLRVREGDDLVLRDWPEKEEGLSYVDFLKLDSAEAEVLTGKTGLVEAAQELTAYGPGEIVLTHAQGVLVHADRRSYQAPFTPREIKGRTGRGDTCFAAYLGRRLKAPPEEACRFAAAVASLKMEKPGPFMGSVDDVESKLGLY
jgi:sugar/nucleoside kinase (ribokinase family)